MAKCESDFPEEEAEIEATFEAWDDLHRHPRTQINFEHEQWWVTCLHCGAQWSVVNTNDGYDFEEVTPSDESDLPEGDVDHDAEDRQAHDAERNERPGY